VAKCLADAAAAWAWSQRDEDVQKAEQRGADAELEACCEWLRDQGGCHGIATMLHAARRPAPPTLREQALAALDEPARDALLRPADALLQSWPEIRLPPAAGRSRRNARRWLASIQSALSDSPPARVTSDA
jgi:hypothetical protein